MQHYSDDELLKLFFDGDNPNYAFNLIVRKHQEAVYWHVRRLVISHEDANDIVQEVFLKAWKALPAFRGDAALFTWLYRIATNESLSFLKKKKRRALISLRDADKQLEETLEADVYYQGSDIQKKIQKAILKLPEKQRAVFNLRYYDEMKYEDMAEVLSTTVGALKASYHHAVKKIEKYIMA
ncbi:MAG: sigma-70 family RNA polymerase sigma factor [Bacteroidales bacterium]|nr:sigma-70 family RNA polymerase sigma factor [Bacteroidales bacterium]